MPRGRIIDKRISKSQKFARLKLWTSRTLYLMMYPHVDIEGKLEANPELFKGEICPLLNITPKKIMECLEDLEAVKLIKLWKVGDDHYLQITRFEEFQTLQPDREAPSKIPGPNHESSGVDLGKSQKITIKSKSKFKFKEKIYVEQARRLFDFWKEKMGKPKSIFTTGRKNKIIARLKEGYPEEDCMKAIENVSKSDFHMGANDNGKQYNDIELIFRNGEKLEGYRDWKQQDNKFSQEEKRLMGEWMLLSSEERLRYIVQWQKRKDPDSKISDETGGRLMFKKELEKKYLTR